MSAHSSEIPPSERICSRLLAILVVCWFAVAWAHLYFFGYAGMDSWTLAGPAATAKFPFVIKTPFLGTFIGSDKGWGLHWPGGPLLTSIITSFLPHNPIVFVSIYLTYWMLTALAASALARRLTGSRWMGIAAFLLVASDWTCFSEAWYERYEMLGSAVAIAAILVLFSRRDKCPVARAVFICAAFFLLPLLQPIFVGLGAAWVAYLAFRRWVLKQPRKELLLAAGGYAAGWAFFLIYFFSQPWLLAQFRNHAQRNLEITRNFPLHGIHKFLHYLVFVGRPLGVATVVYVIAIAGALGLLLALWKSRGAWREYFLREDLEIFSAIGFVVTLWLAQFTYHSTYWSAAMPFAAPMACLTAWRLIEAFPRRRLILAPAFAVLVLLQLTFFPARTYMWSKCGFANMRSQLRTFGNSLPHGGNLFIPEVLWDTYADAPPNVYLNSLPYSAGDPMQKDYAAFILARVQKGDVFIVDTFESHPPKIDPRQLGWKEIGKCSLVYGGLGGRHGYDMTAYRKE